MILTENNKKVEVLAPAGSYDIMTAVINAGADAVYLGGDMFGARAYAGNFDQAQLLRAIDYVHLHDRKIYMTVNTLLKETEITKYLIPYLVPYYEAGLDAVIVQDMGVWKAVKEHFPDLAIHTSTQMNVTGSYSAKLMEKMGATRVVTARELGLDEIRQIREHTNLEIESFVHGALCYCYSGECLLSSMNGGRSGNRGRCAQPCRMAYDVFDDTGKKLTAASQGYVLSPKDMCTLSVLPDVIEAGVNSLKIEGRMKNQTYAAGVTAMYRKYVDLYLEKGRDGYHVSEKDLHDLMDIYNRGAFTQGYYTNTKGKDMISLSRPNHMGTRALKVIDNKRGRVTFEALESLNAQDVFEVDKEYSFAIGSAYQTGDRFVLNLPQKYDFHVGRTIFRTKNQSLAEWVEQDFVNTTVKKPVTATFYASVGEPVRLTLSDGTDEISVEGDLATQAMNQPLSKEKAAARIAKLGDTDFVAEYVDVKMDDDVFIPVGQLNGLRRSAVDQLSEAIITKWRRTYQEPESDKLLQSGGNSSISQEISGGLGSRPGTTVLVTDWKQASEAIKISEVRSIYYEFSMFDKMDDHEIRKRIAELLKQCDDAGKMAAIALPHVMRGRNSDKLKTFLGECNQAGMRLFLVRNLEEIGLLSVFAQESDGQDHIQLITDANLYVWNTYAAHMLSQIAQHNHLQVIRITLPLELTHVELSAIRKTLTNADFELVVYSKPALMISEQCVKKTLGLCDHANGCVTMKKGKNEEYRVKSVCSYCYSILYDSQYMSITDKEKEIGKIAPNFVRYELIDNTYSVKQIMEQSSKTTEDASVNRGHFLLGVE